jgi:hypothetical protein
MSVKLLRRILALLIVTAYLGAAMLQVAPGYAANTKMDHAAVGGMTHDQDQPGDKMPCKGMLPNCMTDIGCIFLITLPIPDVDLFTPTTWSSVIYDSASDALHGRTIKPALGPPISLV